MKRKLLSIALGAVGFCCLPEDLVAQVVNSVFGQYRLTGGGATLPSNFTIGNTFQAGSALIVRGDQMGTPTGEVFSTYAPTNSDTYWRLFYNNSEYFNLYKQVGNAQINLNAQLGNLLFRTNDLPRMRVNPSITYGSLNGFTNIPADGFVAITPTAAFFTAGPQGPFSRLHLAEGGGDNAQSFGYRLWERNGITFTGNSDHGYIGHKYAEGDVTDMVIQWSDNPGVAKADRMRFIFTSQYQVSPASRMNSLDGLEAMRMWPADGNNVNVGVGDFAAVPTDPTERLDVLTGRLRLRALPVSTVDNTLNKVMVVDNTGVVKWRDASTLMGIADCNWTQPTGAIGNHVSTAYAAGAVSGCPDAGEAVGIGVDLSATTPTAKFMVQTDQYVTGASIRSTTPNPADSKALELFASGGAVYNFGLHVQTTGPTGSNCTGVNIVTLTPAVNWTRGVVVTTSGATQSARGAMLTVADNATYTAGVLAEVYRGTSQSFGLFGRTEAVATVNVGAVGFAAEGSFGLPLPAKRTGVLGVAQSTEDAMVCYGVYGAAYGPDNTSGTNGHTKWAGYFPGYTYTPGAAWSASDEQLKQNIADLAPEVALEKLSHLRPKTYDFDQGQFAFMHLPTEHQFGLLAQNVAEVLPELVTTIHQPAQVDSAGQQVNPAIDFKAMNYQGLIPLLIAGFQEQQQQIAELRDQLNACCAADGQGDTRSAPQGAAGAVVAASPELLTIAPNPFTDRTTIRYNVPAGGRIRLEVGTQDGRRIDLLREEKAQAGTFTYEWNTAGMGPGTYLVTLLLDDKVIVKKAVKVAR